jgi:hypothetical protein
LAARFSHLSKAFIRAEVPPFFRMTFYFRIKKDILTAPAELRQAQTLCGLPEPFQIPKTRKLFKPN